MTSRHAPLIAAAAALLAAVALVPRAARAADPDLPDVSRIRGAPVIQVLPPDAIPSIDDPRFVPAAKADFMQDEEPVLGVVHEGQAKAYSIWHLDRHEVVNDQLGDDPIAATW